MKKLLLPLILIIVNSAALLSQEICDNGIDDDGDGLIDCYDDDCSGNASCDDFFGWKSLIDDCVNPKSADDLFNVQQKWKNNRWNNSNASIMDRQVITGDIDNDGTVEVLIPYKNVNTTAIIILNGVDGSLKDSIAIDHGLIANSMGNLAIADVDNDGDAEIFAGIRFNGGAKTIYSFDHLGNLLWSTDLDKGSVNISLADFDQDGISELFVNKTILNALNGDTLILDTDFPKYSTLAADILSGCMSCDGLELIEANAVYSVDLINDTIIEVARINNADENNTRMSIADMNLDGQLDIVASHQDSGLYIWDPLISKYLVKESNIKTFYPNFRSTAYPVLANFDTDSFPEIFIMGSDGNLSGDPDYGLFINCDAVSWENPDTLTVDSMFPINDNSSWTGATAFDFDCDDISEIIIVGLDSLFIITPTGIVSSYLCTSNTVDQSPTVADIDGDGHAEIVCGCGDHPSGSSAVIDPGFAAFEPINDNWPLTRKVWNQERYDVVNINDDLTIPIIKQPKHLSTNIQINGDRRQVAYWDENGNPFCSEYGNDVSLQIIDIDSVSNNCEYSTTIEICNLSNVLTLFDDLNLTVYDQNTLAVVMETILLSPFAPDSCYLVTLSFERSSDATLQLFINDDGNGLSGAPNTSFVECDIDNNQDSISISKSTEVKLPADTTFDCDVTVNISITPQTNYSGYDIFWLPQNETTDTILVTDTGTYIVNAISTTGSCGSSDTIIISQESCDTPDVVSEFLFIPNVFAPGGNNSLFNIKAEGVDFLSVEVFNRFGELLFQTNNQNESWDGTYLGEPTIDDNYVYKLNGQFLSGKTINEVGNVLLIR